MSAEYKVCPATEGCIADKCSGLYRIDDNGQARTPYGQEGKICHRITFAINHNKRMHNKEFEENWSGLEK